jgi:isoleucyl-tRNA synthetase
LRDIARLMAPFTPFIAEAINQELSSGLIDAKPSVHMESYPQPHPETLDQQLLRGMAEIRGLVEEARALREQRGVPTRQPLARAVVSGRDLPEELRAVLAAELNVGEVLCEGGDQAARASIRLDFELTPELRREGLLRGLVRQVQNLRKRTGLQPGELVELALRADPELLAAARSGQEQLRAQCFLSEVQLLDWGQEPPPGFVAVSQDKVQEERAWLSLRSRPEQSQ